MHEHRMHDWGYEAEAGPGLDGRRIEAMRGKVLGGSLLHQRHGVYARRARRLRPLGQDGRNRLVLCRGSSLFQARRELGKRRRPVARRGWPARHRVRPDHRSDFQRVDRSRRAAGHPVTSDYNGAQSVGFGRGQYTIRDGRRVVRVARLPRPAPRAQEPHRPDARAVTRVSIESGRARGVEIFEGGQTRSSAPRARSS